MTIITEIRQKKNCWAFASRRSRSLKVIGSNKERSKTTYDFLLVIHSNKMGLSRTVYEINGNSRRTSQIFPTPVYLTLPPMEFLLEFSNSGSTVKQYWSCRYQAVKRAWRNMHSFIYHKRVWWTDGQADGSAITFIALCMHCTLTRNKNHIILPVLMTEYRWTPLRVQNCTPVQMHQWMLVETTRVTEFEYYFVCTRKGRSPIFCHESWQNDILVLELWMSPLHWVLNW